MNEDFIALVHAERIHIDECIKSLDVLKSNTNGLAGRELALSFTKLQEAKMWLGKALEVAGSELPAEYRDNSPENTGTPPDFLNPDIEESGVNSDLESE